MVNLISVDINEYEDNFKVNDKVTVFHYFDNNDSKWSYVKARPYQAGDENGSKTSYSDSSGKTHYLLGVFTVSKVFIKKMWVK